MVASAKKQRSHGSESQDQVQDTVAGSPVSASASGATQAAAACAPNDAAGQKVLHPMTDSTPLASATTTTTANICNNTSTDVAPDGAGLVGVRMVCTWHGNVWAFGCPVVQCIVVSNDSGKCGSSSSIPPFLKLWLLHKTRASLHGFVLFFLCCLALAAPLAWQAGMRSVQTKQKGEVWHLDLHHPMRPQAPERQVCSFYS